MPVVQPPPAAGTHVNENANELVALLAALTELKKGRQGVRLPADWTGVAGKVADAFNEVVEQNERMSSELARLSRTVGKEGKLGQRLSLGDVRGFWAESVESVNELIDDLVHPTSETSRVIGAVAQGEVRCRDVAQCEAGRAARELELIQRQSAAEEVVDEAGAVGYGAG